MNQELEPPTPKENELYFDNTRERRESETLINYYWKGLTFVGASMIALSVAFFVIDLGGQSFQVPLGGIALGLILLVAGILLRKFVSRIIAIASLVALILLFIFQLAGYDVAISTDIGLIVLIGVTIKLIFSTFRYHRSNHKIS